MPRHGGDISMSTGNQKKEKVRVSVKGRPVVTSFLLWEVLSYVRVFACQHSDTR